MTTEIRKRAATAAREWLREMLERRDESKVMYNGYSYGEGYVAGYSMAKAEDEPFLICDGCGRTNDRCKCDPLYDVDDLDEERHGKL